MNHPLTDAQCQQMRVEASRRYHLMLADLDRQVRDLGERQMPIDDYTAQYNAIEATRRMLKAQREREQAVE